MHYRSSRLFGDLKATEEKIKDNYSSGQLIDVLDELLINAIRPMLESTTWMDSYVANILSWYNTNNKRKISTVPKPKLMTLLTTFLLLTDVDEKIDCLKQMRLERSFLFSALSDWLKLANCYVDAVVRWEASGRQLVGEESRVKVLRKTLCARKDGRDLHLATLDTAFWEHNAVAFKMAIIEKYHRSMIMEAKSVYVRMDHRLDLEDLIQDMAVVTSKAIDKYDQSRGTLTTHIEWWWTSVKSAAIDRLINQDSQLSLEEHHSSLANQASEESVEDTLIRKEQLSRLQEIALAVDPTGLGRIMLGIYVT